MATTDDQTDAVPPVPGMRLDAVHLTKAVNPGQEDSPIILHDVSLSVRPGEFVAIVGKSGAGKSTLIDVLSGRRSSFGHVFLNGHDLRQVYDHYRSALGYVPQHGILHDTLTVERSLRYAARLRLPPRMPPDEIDMRIARALSEVELPPRLRTQPIHTLSNGEQKRVNIAAELLTGPLLFFLDEPTSGLDPLLEKKMMLTLRHMANAGRTVILVTHATANIAMCDYVAFMSESYLTYLGPPADALAFFAVEEFADIYEVIDGCGAYWQKQFHTPWVLHYDELIAKRQEAHANNDNTSEPAPFAVTTADELFSQFKTLTQRMFEVTRRDRVAMFLLVAVMPIIALAILILTDSHALVGAETLPERRTYIAWRTAESTLVIIGLAAIILGLFGASYELVKERAIFLHEVMVNLKIGPYLVSKLAVLAGFGMVQGALFMAVLALKLRFPSAGVFMPAPLEMFITLLLSTIACLALGMLISSIANSLNTTTYIVMVILFMQIIFSGATLPLNKTTELFANFTILHWTVDGLGTTIHMEKLGLQTQVCTLHDCSIIPIGVQSMGVRYGTNLDHLMTVWGILVGFATVFIGLTYFFVHTTAHSRR